MKTIVIGDIHQNLNIPKAILEIEKDFDEIVFLGDWFDSFTNPFSIAETAEYMMEIYNNPSINSIFIVGNHDLSYFEVAPICRQNKTQHNRLYPCSGFTNSKASKISKIITEEFISHCKLAYYSNGYLMSHAGILPHLFKVNDTLKSFMERLDCYWKNFRNPMICGCFHNSVFAAGWARGGPAPLGGLLWCDWRYEFDDKLEWPQIVGHTEHKQPPSQKGNSVCIDNQMGYYAVTETSKPFEIKNCFNN